MTGCAEVTGAEGKTTRAMPGFVGDAETADRKCLIYRIGSCYWARLISSNNLDDLLEEVDAEIEEVGVDDKGGCWLSVDDFAIISDDHAEWLEERTKGLLLAFSSHVQSKTSKTREECLADMLEAVIGFPELAEDQPGGLFATLELLRHEGLVAILEAPED